MSEVSPVRVSVSGARLRGGEGDALAIRGRGFLARTPSSVILSVTYDPPGSVVLALGVSLVLVGLLILLPPSLTAGGFVPGALLWWWVLRSLRARPLRLELTPEIVREAVCAPDGRSLAVRIDGDARARVPAGWIGVRFDGPLGQRLSLAELWPTLRTSPVRSVGVHPIVAVILGHLGVMLLLGVALIGLGIGPGIARRHRRGAPPNAARAAGTSSTVAAATAQARDEMRAIADAGAARTAVGHCPTIADLLAQRTLPSRINGLDPWGSAYAIECTAMGLVVVHSAGPDGKFGDDDDLVGP